ncbi:hypothetical protein BX666DRAFT_556542 [Dichotomocladium elegans]|nr:hypothetical protein BX666DRAFT_556542 [Dichotomocladium elegans]
MYSTHATISSLVNDLPRKRHPMPNVINPPPNLPRHQKTTATTTIAPAPRHHGWNTSIKASCSRGLSGFLSEAASTVGPPGFDSVENAVQPTLYHSGMREAVCVVVEGVRGVRGVRGGVVPVKAGGRLRWVVSIVPNSVLRPERLLPKLRKSGSKSAGMARSSSWRLTAGSSCVSNTGACGSCDMGKLITGTSLSGPATLSPSLACCIVRRRREAGLEEY